MMDILDGWQQLQFDLGLPCTAIYTFPMVPAHRKTTGELYQRCPQCHSKSNGMSFHDGEQMDPADDRACWGLWLSQPFFTDPQSAYTDPVSIGNHLDLTCNTCHHKWVGSLVEVAPDLLDGEL